MGKSIHLSIQRDGNTQRETCFSSEFCFSKNWLVNSNLQLPPNGFQQRGHTQGGPLAATSNCFPGETTQEVKLLQETLNRAPIVPSSKLRDTIGSIHQESLQAREWSLSDVLLGHQIFINTDLYKYVLIIFKDITE